MSRFILNFSFLFIINVIFFLFLFLIIFFAIFQILPYLQVLARSSPEDKFLLVTRLNGYALPNNKEEWIEKHKNKIGKLQFN